MKSSNMYVEEKLAVINYWKVYDGKYYCDVG